MAGSAYNLTYVKKKAHSLIERLSESELEEILHLLERISERKPTGSVEEGWRAFMEMGEDGLGSSLHNASEAHDKYLYAVKRA
jgi:hypothetical protein